MQAARKRSRHLSNVVTAVVVVACLIGGGIGYLVLRILLDLQ